MVKFRIRSTLSWMDNSWFLPYNNQSLTKSDWATSCLQTIPRPTLPFGNDLRRCQNIVCLWSLSKWGQPDHSWTVIQFSQKKTWLLWHGNVCHQSAWDFSQHHLVPTQSCEVRQWHHPGSSTENWGTGSFLSKRLFCLDAALLYMMMQRLSFRGFLQCVLFWLCSSRLHCGGSKHRYHCLAHVGKKHYFFPPDSPHADFWQNEMPQFYLGVLWVKSAVPAIFRANTPLFVVLQGWDSANNTGLLQFSSTNRKPQPGLRAPARLTVMWLRILWLSRGIPGGRNKPLSATSL